MDKGYDELFDTRDKDDAMYHRVIPTLDISIFKKALENDVKIINSAEFDLAKWAKFKYGLLKYETEWNMNVFKWSINEDNETCPFAFIDIDYDVLEDKQTRYFQVHMAFEDLFLISNASLSSIFQIIDDERDYDSSNDLDCSDDSDNESHHSTHSTYSDHCG